MIKLYNATHTQKTCAMSFCSSNKQFSPDHFHMHNHSYQGQTILDIVVAAQKAQLTLMVIPLYSFTTDI